MSFSLAGFKTKSYIGTVFSQPMQIAGSAARAIKLSFNWLAYGASSINQNIVVSIQLQGGSPAQVSPVLDLIRSIYIDNTGSPDAVYVQFQDTGFTVVAQPNSIGWYPVFTNSFQFLVAIFGITNSNIPQCAMYVTNVRVEPFTDVAIQEVTPQNLASPTLGGGSSIFSIVPVDNGQDYNNGNLTISGGGGNGATAHGVLDVWGRFTSVVIDNPGTGYTGTPTVTPTGGQIAIPAYNPNGNYGPGANRVNYNGIEWQWLNGGGLGGSIAVGSPQWNTFTSYGSASQVSNNGFIYEAIQFVPGGDNIDISNTTYWHFIGSALPQAPYWLSSGSAPDTTVTFNTLLTASANPIVSNGLGIPALGDQATNYIDTLVGAGVFRQNMFGTPYVSGFIYVTHFHVNVLSFGAGNTWLFEDSIGYSPFAFKPGAGGVQMELQKMNMKLDATQNWQLNCTVFGAALTAQHSFAFTYSQQ